MARNFTLAALILRCKQRADMENSSFIGDAEWRGLISSAYGEFYSYVVETGMGFRECEHGFNSSAMVSNGRGGGSIPIPTDHLSTLAVDQQEGGRWRSLGEMMFQERNFFSDEGGRSRGVFWRLINDRLHIFPMPATGVNYRHTYIPQPQDFSSITDDTVTIDVHTPDGEEFIIWHVTINALSKEESDVRPAVAARERMRERVIDWAIKRALANPRRPMVDGLDGGSSGLPSWILGWEDRY